MIVAGKAAGRTEYQKKIARIAIMMAIHAATFTRISPCLSRRLEPSAGVGEGGMFARSAIINGSAEG